ncbi:MAG TPA: peptide-methionine (S)-S-oxide reductase [Alphaproteobacteria bacterium]|nr:peptide-methionine (S)-S-oxide reductase [Alphaproteobacteria bacterium]HAJ45990.1 peptide-methionine (S)-S-oxide reductase [Alphaproteobacteria bacterium]
MRVIVAALAALIVGATALIAKDLTPAPYPQVPAGAETAIFAIGCFWCAESAFEGKPGIISVTSGHTGGQTKNPTYEDVGQGGTGHAEAILIVYDPKKTTYEDLLYRFWRNADPYSANGQFCDRGSQYRPEIFVKDAAQRKAAEASKAELEKQDKFKGKIVVKITDASTFYTAEKYHQDFAVLNPDHYKRYRFGCGRDDRLDAIWGKEARAGDPEH